MQQLARNYMDGTKPDTPQGVNVGNLQAGLGNAWDCLQTLGVGLAFVTAGVVGLTVANAGLILVDATAGDVTLNLPSIAPSAAALAGALFQVKRVDATANKVTINRGGADTIDGQTSVSLVGQYDFFEMRCDGVSAWRPLNQLANQQRARDLIGAGVLSFRNKVRNPKMDIAARGASIAAATNVYTLDGWATGNAVSTAVYTASQQADVMAGSDCQSSLRVTVTTADAAVTATKQNFVAQNIEGFLVRDLLGNPIALRFEVKSPKAGAHCVALQNSGQDRSYVWQYAITAANTWQVVTLALPTGLPAAGTWNFTSGVGLRLVFPLMMGANFQTAAGAWQVGDFKATAAQQNLLDTVGNVFAVTGVQLEKGGASTPLEHRDIATELNLCNRYLQTVYVSMLTGGAPQDYSIVPMRAGPAITVQTAGWTGGSLGATSNQSFRQTTFATGAGSGTVYASAEL